MDKEVLKAAINSVCNALAFLPQDFGEDRREAWIYGVLLGWSPAAMKEVAAKHNWSLERVALLRKYHAVVKEFIKTT